jgi:hypothetical protein
MHLGYLDDLEPPRQQGRQNVSKTPRSALGSQHLAPLALRQTPEARALAHTEAQAQESASAQMAPAQQRALLGMNSQGLGLTLG